MIGGMGTFADAGDSPAGQGHTPYLPEPTGPRPVGTTSLCLKDVSRPDPWAAGVSARELMVSLWYPAAPSGGRRARYMTPAESALQLTSRGLTGVPRDALSTVRTNAVTDATPAGRQRDLPLVVLSPGFTNSRSTLTALAEDLASHGYVVAGIDHTYESLATAFPDGRVTTCLAREAPRSGRGEKVVAGRAADVSFVLGELTGAHPPWPGAGLIDPLRMAMAGHSPAARPPSPPCWPTPASAPASTWTAPLTPRSRMTACHGRFCSWASNPTTPRESGESPGSQAPRAPGSVTGNS